MVDCTLQSVNCFLRRRFYTCRVPIYSSKRTQKRNFFVLHALE